MKLFFFPLIVVITIFLFASTARSQEKALFSIDRSVFRVFWYFPISSSLSTKISWFEIVKCERADDASSCKDVVARLPVGRALSQGELFLQADAHGMMRLKYRDQKADNDSVTIALADLDQKLWYPRLELCTSEYERVGCEYRLQVDEDTRSLKLKIYFSPSN